MSERTWGVLFACSVGVLMLAVLLIRSDPVPGWVLLVYPLVGGLLGLAASRTSPSADQMAWIETGAIAAAAVVLFAGALNLLLAEAIVREMRTGQMAVPGQSLMFSATLAASGLLWWVLQRRLTRIRLSGTDHRSFEARIPAE